MRLTLTLGLLVSLVACGGSGNHLKEENRTVTRVGGTCGLWQVEPSGSPTLTRVTATCAPGLSCVGTVNVETPDELSKRFGRCLPEMAEICDPTKVPTGCPQGLTCWLSPGSSATGRCLVSCQASHDCEAPYQVCVSSSCEFQRCPLAGDLDAGVMAACPPDARCERGICVQK